MVFGCKKKKQVEVEQSVEPARHTSQSITLDEIPKVLDDLLTLRKKHLLQKLNPIEINLTLKEN